MKEDFETKITAAEQTIETMKSAAAKLEKQLVCGSLTLCNVM